MERFRFGEFEFDGDTRVLTHKGKEVKLQAQPALLLGVLLARREQVVSREELKSAIWGNDTHVDFEKGLNFCMGQVRAALRDDAARPVYIRTFPKLGYQFIAPVVAISDAVPTVGPLEAGRASPRTRVKPLLYALAAIVIFAVGIVAVSLGIKRSGPPNLAVVRFDSETNSPITQALADELTDDVTVRLTSASDGRYRVIGNAAILRTPRAQRDLRVIGSSLNSRYTVLGQVWADGDKVTVLAHLIRLPDLTHIWVVRFERKGEEATKVEAEAAAEIAAQLAASMHNQPDKAGSFQAGNH